MTKMPELADSILSVDGRVATLTPNRDDVRNALTGTQIHEEIVSVVEWLNASEGISVLVLTGNGSAFSSGGNVKDVAERKGMFAGDVYELQNLSAKHPADVARHGKLGNTCHRGR